MPNFFEKQLEERPLTTLVLLILVVAGVFLGLGVVTWIANYSLGAKNWVKSKIGTAPAANASAPAPGK